MHLDVNESWNYEARRYYFNIVGKYGLPVSNVLKKAGKLDIKTIYPLHGPILSDEIPEVLRLYTIWSSYEPEDKGVFIAYASMHGNTAEAARKMKEILEEKGAKVAISDLSRSDMAENVENAFRYSTLLCMAPSYDGTVFTPMADFIHRLKTKLYQNRRVAQLQLQLAGDFVDHVIGSVFLGLDVYLAGLHLLKTHHGHRVPLKL